MAYTTDMESTFYLVYTKTYVSKVTISSLSIDDSITSTITSTSYRTITPSSTTSRSQTSSSSSEASTSESIANYSTLAAAESTKIKATSSSASTIALAIGIPIGILSLFTLAFLIWFFLKKQKFAKVRAGNLQVTDYDNTLKKTLTGNFGRFKQKILPTHSGVKKSPITVKSEEMINYLNGPEKQLNVQKTFFRKSFMNKLSDVNQETPTSTANPYANKLSGFISPMILKKFNLCGTPVSKELPLDPSINNSSTLIMKQESIHPSKKPLPFPPVVNTFIPTSLNNMENKVPEEKIKSRVESIQNHSYCSVIRPYEKVLDDEVTLVVGEKVRILRTHTDGWCLVSKEDSSRGVVPKLCLRYRSSSLTNK